MLFNPFVLHTTFLQHFLDWWTASFIKKKNNFPDGSFGKKVVLSIIAASTKPLELLRLAVLVWVGTNVLAGVTLKHMTGFRAKMNESTSDTLTCSLDKWMALDCRALWAEEDKGLLKFVALTGDHRTSISNLYYVGVTFADGDLGQRWLGTMVHMCRIPSPSDDRRKGRVGCKQLGEVADPGGVQRGPGWVGGGCRDNTESNFWKKRFTSRAYVWSPGLVTVLCLSQLCCQLCMALPPGLQGVWCVWCQNSSLAAPLPPHSIFSPPSSVHFINASVDEISIAVDQRAIINRLK